MSPPSSSDQLSAQRALVELTPLEGGEPYQDALALERPLELWVQGAPFATLMCTPGADEALALGFLWSSGVIEARDDVVSLAPCERSPQHRLHVWLASGVQRPQPRATYSSSSCGLCSLTSAEGLVGEQARVWPTSCTSDELRRALSELERAMPLFQQTGGCHGALLLDPSNTPRVSFEDVGRHNAVDKALGHALQRGWSEGVSAERERWGLAGWRLVVSSRAGFEVVHKAARAGVGVVICLGAASSLAHEAAQRAGLTLLSFARAHRAHRHTPLKG